MLSHTIDFESSNLVSYTDVIAW